MDRPAQFLHLVLRQAYIQYVTFLSGIGAGAGPISYAAAKGLNDKLRQLLFVPLGEDHGLHGDILLVQPVQNDG